MQHIDFLAHFRPQKMLKGAFHALSIDVKKNKKIPGLNLMHCDSTQLHSGNFFLPARYGDLVLIFLAFDSEHYWFVAQCGAVLNHLGHCLYCLFCDVSFSGSMCLKLADTFGPLI